MERNCRECQILNSWILQAVSDLHYNANQMTELANQFAKGEDHRRLFRELQDASVRTKERLKAYRETLHLHQECQHFPNTPQEPDKSYLS